MIGFGSNKFTQNPMDYELVDIISPDNSKTLWISSKGKTYKYIIPYRFFNPEDMSETNRFTFYLNDGKPKLCS